jgi:heptose-I-phosphate ethanolaminephosphotransferase
MPKSKDTTPQEAEESANESKRFVHEYNILSDKYDEMRPRILKGTTDYDKLRDAYLKNKKKK